MEGLHVASCPLLMNHLPVKKVLNFDLYYLATLNNPFIHYKILQMNIIYWFLILVYNLLRD